MISRVHGEKPQYVRPRWRQTIYLTRCFALTRWPLQMVYSPDHSGSAIWQVYLQGKKYEMRFPNIELQIWRVHTDGPTGWGAVNVLKQVSTGTTIDACGHELGDDDAHQGVITDSEGVPKGSTNINVEKATAGGNSPQPFS